ncbi:glycoside hydrolase family 3 N-terminal domain-containing protein [Candidatus Poriferisocius sp.]|uniref:glycoside hydrolase family 3 N-terminal domain-containing protein n=1 Tax=Candidatus Poriferisocius sp. TaxID=3101276 RepID=UPI003B02AC11
MPDPRHGMDGHDPSAHHRDAGLPIAERVADLMARMTLEEKAAQVVGVFPAVFMGPNGPDLDKLSQMIPHGVGHICMGGGLARQPHDLAVALNAIQEWLRDNTRLGIPAMVHNEALCGLAQESATAFPTAIGLAATFQPQLIEQMAVVAGREARSVGINHVLSPVLDVNRDARWGRVHETYGEDPFLCTAMGIAFVRGMQTDDLGSGTIATGKHFLGYSYTEGALNQTASPIGPRAVYEVYALPFEGAIREAGLASVMNSYSEIDGVPVAASPEILTDLLREKLGFQGSVVADYSAVARLCQPHAVAGTVAEAGVLALSAGLDIELPTGICYSSLPDSIRNGELDESVLDLAVERALTQRFQVGLMDSPTVDPDRASAAFTQPEALELARGITDASIVLLENDGTLPLGSDVGSVAVIGPMADTLRGLFAAYTPSAGAELGLALSQGLGGSMAGVFGGGDDAEDPADESSPDPTLDAVAKVFHSTGSIIDSVELDRAIGGMYPEMGTIADAIAQYAPVTSVKGCGWTSLDEDGIDEAVAAARAADVVVLAVGEKTGWVGDATGGEGRDRKTLELPGAQPQLVRRVIDTGVPTVAVVVSGRPLDIAGDLAGAKAILQVWHPGSEGPEAIGAALFGERNPGGKLPVSFPAGVGASPTYHGHKHGSGSSSDRAYVDGPSTPVWAFGHGRSYTTFEISDLTLSQPSVPAGEVVVVGCGVKNTGDRAGDEVVQLYVRDVVGSVTRPVRQLAGFHRVSLEPGESSRVEFDFDTSQLAFLDRSFELVVEEGDVEVMVGRSSEDLPLRAGLKLTGSLRLDHRTSFTTPSRAV